MKHGSVVVGYLMIVCAFWASLFRIFLFYGISAVKLNILFPIKISFGSFNCGSRGDDASHKRHRLN